MSKKNLLNESQVRQFMKLACLQPLTAGFVESLTETATAETEDLDELRTGRRGGVGPTDGTHNLGRGRGQGEAADGTLYEEDDEADLHDLENADADLDHADDLEDDAAEDLGDIGALDPDAAGGDQMISVQDLMSALTAALEDVTGQAVEAEIEDGPVEDEVEMDVELDATDDAAASMEADTEMEMSDEPLEEGGDKKGDEPADDLDYEKKNESAKATDDLVEQITKRVAARILKSALAKK